MLAARDLFPVDGHLPLVEGDSQLVDGDELEGGLEGELEDGIDDELEDGLEDELEDGLEDELEGGLEDDDKEPPAVFGAGKLSMAALFVVVFAAGRAAVTCCCAAGCSAETGCAAGRSTETGLFMLTRVWWVLVLLSISLWSPGQRMEPVSQ